MKPFYTPISSQNGPFCRSRTLPCRKNRTPVKFSFFLIFASLLASGCATLPSHYVRVEPPPIRSFPPIQPGFVCLPVVISFPPGRDVVQDVTNLFKGGIKQLAQNIILKSKLKFLWDKMAGPIYLDKDLWLLVHPQTMSMGHRRVVLKSGPTFQPVLEMFASPELVFGPKPLLPPKSMPPLQRFLPQPAFFEA